MQTILLYLATVLIWGTTWIAIVKQLGHVPVACSVAYRFIICYFILYFYCILKKVSLRFPLKMHLIFASVGLGIFCLNYICFYTSASYIASGLVSVIFSLISIFNTILAGIFLGKKLSIRHYLGISIGFLGICTLFYPDIVRSNFDTKLLQGVSLALLGTLLASGAQTLIAIGMKKGMKTLPSMTISMGYGALYNILIALVFSPYVAIDFGFTYMSSLIYLSLVGSVASFGCYFALIRKLGPEKSAYSATLYPAVALMLSSIFESYSWTSLGFLGFALIIWGNVLVLGKAKTAATNKN